VVVGSFVLFLLYASHWPGLRELRIVNSLIEEVFFVNKFSSKMLKAQNTWSKLLNGSPYLFFSVVCVWLMLQAKFGHEVILHVKRFLKETISCNIDFCTFWRFS